MNEHVAVHRGADSIYVAGTENYDNPKRTNVRTVSYTHLVAGDEFAWKVEQTFCNGSLIYNKGVFDASCRGEELEFRNNS